MSELEPPVKRRDLPDSVLRLRAEAEAADEAVEPVLQPRIDAHLATYTSVVDELARLHRDTTDRSDVPIGTDTRWSALWEISGRCIAIANVVLHDLRGGFTSAMDGSLRGLHEAGQLLAALTNPDETADLERWLEGKWVRPAQARDALGRQQAAALEAHRAAGGEDPGVGDIVELGKELYSYLSASSHLERGSFPELISVPMRRFVYGPHPDPWTRAAHVSYAGDALEGVALSVGSAFSHILQDRGPLEYVRNDLIERIHRVQVEQPIDRHKPT